MALNQKQKESKTINDKEIFDRLVEQWRDETGMYSSITKKIKHHAYRKMILMGNKAIPWILAD